MFIGFHKRLGFTPMYFETPDVTSGGQVANSPTVQPDQGQGGMGEQPTAQQGGAFNWGFFPDVPEDQRPLLEPHLRGVMGHVTRIEQQYAPYKPFLQAGYTSQEEINGILGFAQAFDWDPIGAWFDLGQTLQQQGIITDEIDFEEVRALMDGTYVDDEGSFGNELPEGLDPNNPLSQVVMQQNQTIEELKEMVEGLNRTHQDREVRLQQARSQRLLERAITDIQVALRNSGIPDEAYTREMIMGQLVTHRGNANSVIQSLTGFRNAGVKNVIQNATRRPGDPAMPRGAPRPPKARSPGRPRDSWDEAYDGALQFLEQNRAAEGQEA